MQAVTFKIIHFFLLGEIFSSGPSTDRHLINTGPAVSVLPHAISLSYPPSNFPRVSGVMYGSAAGTLTLFTPPQMTARNQEPREGRYDRWRVRWSSKSRSCRTWWTLRLTRTLFWVWYRIHRSVFFLLHETAIFKIRSRATHCVIPELVNISSMVRCKRNKTRWGE